LYSNRELLPQWQPGLLHDEFIQHHPHPVHKLTYQIGRRKMVMTETILQNDLPEHYEVTYVMKGVFNRIHTSFTSTDSTTVKWIAIHEFRFKGLMKLVSLFMKGDFQMQSWMIMNNFKRFVVR
jgi:hypothetical protein